MVSLQNSFFKELEPVQSKGETSRRIKNRLKRKKVKEKMKRGYLEMGPINLSLAINNVKVENKTFFIYEARLAECD
jgi:CopG family transcriptional regulator/antitoxin EndoAI